MRKHGLLFLSALLLWAQFMAPDMAYAYKVKNLCIVNCGVPIGFINASLAVVILPSSSSMGSTQLKWTWDFEPRKPWFKLGCVYVHVNDQMNANVVQCEHPGNTYTTNISWITAGNMYTFILSPYVGDTVPVDSLIQIVAAPGKQTSVDVTGVLP